LPTHPLHDLPIQLPITYLICTYALPTNFANRFLLSAISISIQDDLIFTAITISYYYDWMIRQPKPLTTFKEQIMPAINKQDNTAIAMAEAVAWLNQNGIRFESLPPYQLKIGPLNFWPGRGTITFDGEDQKRPEKGLDGLALLLESDRMYSCRHYWQPLTEEVQASQFRQIALAKSIRK
jgi:hypothetical protein